MSDPTVTVNDAPRALTDVPPHTTALDWLRGLGLTGAKEGCAEGECGACSVLVSRPGPDGDLRWTAINACLVPALALDGQEVVTAEGLGTPEALHPVQREMADRGGSQCGYCTPGFVCSMAAEYYRPERTDFDVHALSGNLCRCTGYRPIRDAALALDGPDPQDRLAQRANAAAPRVVPTRSEAFARPADTPRGAGAARRAPGRDGPRRGHRPRRRGEPAGAAAVVRRGRGPAAGAAGAVVAADDAIEIGAALTLSEIEGSLEG